MGIKIIAIGNRLMEDDGVAIKAAEALFDDFAQEGIEVIIGETDVEYCLDRINDEDDIIILDAAISNRPWGSVWQLPLCNAIYALYDKQSQHDADLLYALKNKEVHLSGLLICIEAASISFRWGLSEAIQSQFSRICRDIKNIVLEFRSDLQHA